MALRQKENCMSVVPVLFGTDGVRGIAGQYPLEKSLLRKLGAAAAAVYRERVPGHSPVFLFGRDTRGTLLKGMTLVVDCANGSMARIAPAFLRSLGARVLPLGTQPTGRNINAGFGSQHPERMQRLVVARKANGGIAFDGDADRAVFC